MRGSRSLANTCGFLSPSRIAPTMAWPVIPLMSLMTLASCRFICVSAFCMCWTQRDASPMCGCRCRQNVRIIRISSARPERVLQQPIDLQLQQPSAFLDVALAARHVLGIPRVHQEHPYAALLQNVVQRDPIHPRRLHGDGLNATALQPVRQGYQIPGKATEATYRLRVQARRYGHPGCASTCGSIWTSLPLPCYSPGLVNLRDSARLRMVESLSNGVELPFVQRQPAAKQVIAW